MHGSPCQDFSLAGKQAGGDIGSGTRSSLMYETIRIVEKLKPKYVIWENVKNVISKKHIHNFNNYITRMSELGYTSYYQVLNAKDYGIPQNRERVFAISVKNSGLVNFEFPQPQELKLKLKDMLEDEVDEKYYLSEKMINYCMGVNQKESKFPRKERFLQSLNMTNNKNIATTISTSAGNRPVDNFIIGSTQKHTAISKDGIVPTLTSAMGQGGGHVPMHNYNLRIRKLTPKECWRLMGFDDKDFEKATKVNSNTQLYKQAGNSIVVNVLEAILRKLLK